MRDRRRGEAGLFRDSWRTESGALAVPGRATEGGTGTMCSRAANDPHLSFRVAREPVWLTCSAKPAPPQRLLTVTQGYSLLAVLTVNAIPGKVSYPARGNIWRHPAADEGAGKIKLPCLRFFV